MAGCRSLRSVRERDKTRLAIYQPSKQMPRRDKTNVPSDGRNPGRTLPIRHDLRPLYVLTFVIALLMAVASLTGLLYRSSIYATHDLLSTFLPNDAVSLFVGLPLILVSVFLARRGLLLGLLLWPGSLLFVFYNYVVYALAMPLGAALVVYVVLVALSLYATFLLVRSVDGAAVRRWLVGAIPERATGGLLAALGILLFLQAIDAMATAVAGQTQSTVPQLATHVSDLFITPVWVIGGVLLWRRRALGYVIGLGLLFQASMLFIGLILFLLLQPILVSGTLAVSSVVVVFALGLLCFVPFAFFVRAVLLVAARSPPTE